MKFKTLIRNHKKFANAMFLPKEIKAIMLSEDANNQGFFILDTAKANALLEETDFNNDLFISIRQKLFNIDNIETDFLHNINKMKLAERLIDHRIPKKGTAQIFNLNTDYRLNLRPMTYGEVYKAYNDVLLTKI